MYQAVYLTGPPAAGKTTLAKALSKFVVPLRHVTSGGILLAIKRQTIPDLTYDELRARSAEIVSPADVAQIDSYLADNLTGWLEHSHVIFDSHAVTFEAYGARITGFSQDVLRKLSFSAVVALQSNPADLVRRAQNDSRGRIWRDVEHANRLQQLQTSLALVYGVVCGCPVFVIAADTPPDRLAVQARDALRDAGIFLNP